MIVPVFACPGLHFAQVVARIGVQPLGGLLFDDFAFNLKGGAPNLDHFPQARLEFLFRGRQITDTGKIDGEHAHGTGQRIAAKQATAAFAQFLGIQPKAATHGDRIFRRQIGIDIVGEIGDAVFAGNPHERVDRSGIPVKILGDINRRNRKCEDPALGIAFHHHSTEGLVKQVHFRLKITVFVLGKLSAANDRLVSEGGGNRQIKGQIGEGALETDTGRDINIENEFLEALFDLFKGHVIVAHEGGAIGVKTGPGLSPGGLALRGKG